MIIFNYRFILNTPPQAQRNWQGIELCTKNRKPRGWNRLCQQISKLIITRYKPNIECFTGYHITHEVKVNFNVLSSSMENRVRRQVNGANVITPQDGRFRQNQAEFLEERLKPLKISCSVSKSLVLGFSTWTSHSGLFAKAPGNQILAKEYAETTSGTTIILITYPISIT